MLTKTSPLHSLLPTLPVFSLVCDFCVLVFVVWCCGLFWLFSCVCVSFLLRKPRSLHVLNLGTKLRTPLAGKKNIFGTTPHAI
jgi:hypothetical protein